MAVVVVLEFRVIYVSSQVTLIYSLDSNLTVFSLSNSTASMLRESIVSFGYKYFKCGNLETVINKFIRHQK